MIESLPHFVSLVFILTTVATLVLFYPALTEGTIDHSGSKAKIIMMVHVAWLIFQAWLAYNGFYSQVHLHNGRLMMAVAPPLLLIVALFITQEGKIYLAGISLKHLTYLHIIRIPVELVLYWLFLAKAVPQLMTFEGRNFDILAGISAPVVAYIAFRGDTPKTKLLLVWNIISLLLLINIFVNAFLSFPTRFEKFAFDQPNVGLLYFPFIWLPSFIVPVVLFSHLVAIMQLRADLKSENASS